MIQYLHSNNRLPCLYDLPLVLPLPFIVPLADRGGRTMLMSMAAVPANCAAATSSSDNSPSATSRAPVNMNYIRLINPSTCVS